MSQFQQLAYSPLEGLEEAVLQRGLNLEIINGVRVLFPDKSNFKGKLTKIAADGKEKLLVISDYDFTISRFAQRPGVRGASCHKVLEDSGVLGTEYEEKGQAVQRKYYAYEIDPNIDDVTKYGFMEEWVHKSHELLLEFGLTRSLLREAVHRALDRKAMNLRNHLREYFSLLRTQQIPLLIFSAGIGDVLTEVLRQEHILDEEKSADITVISNTCIYSDSLPDEMTGISPCSSAKVPADSPSDLLISFVEPMIHVYNKKASAFIDRHPFFRRTDIKEKTNLVMLGDSPRDVDMNEGMWFTSDRTLNIGFVNDKVIERLDSYLSCGFDILMFDDCGFEVPMHIIQNIIDQSVDIV